MDQFRNKFISNKHKFSKKWGKIKKVIASVGVALAIFTTVHATEEGNISFCASNTTWPVKTKLSAVVSSEDGSEVETSLVLEDVSERKPASIQNNPIQAGIIREFNLLLHNYKDDEDGEDEESDSEATFLACLKFNPEPRHLQEITFEIKENEIFPKPVYTASK